MIRIRKSPRPPAVLRTRGRHQRQALCAAYSRGTRGFEFSDAVYGHAQVREALRTDQHGKCAFCESRFLATGYGEVEHFRPKAGWRQSALEPLERPGYYWLAYEWNNLFLACRLCNGQFKRNLFPLKDPRRRARNHRSLISRESPMLIDPALEDPERFISFTEQMPVAMGDHPRGERTIEVMGLRREELAEERRKHLIIARALLHVVRRGGDAAQEPRALLLTFQRDEQPYAAMIRALLRRVAPDLLAVAYRAAPERPLTHRTARGKRRLSRA